MKTSLKTKAKLNDEQLKEAYKKMWLVRYFEEKVDFFFAQGKIHGTTHLAVGEEASSVGSGAVLRTEDWITATHRGHGQTIAKGTKVNVMMAELFGKTSGTNNGKGGSMHIAELETGNLGANGVVGGGYAIAAGAALSEQMNGTDNVALCYAGDGSTNEGSFHEALNLASVWKLPVIYFIENNMYGMSGSIKEMANIENLSDRAKAYGIPGVTIDGNNIIEVINATAEAVERARKGDGPTLIEAKTYRWKGHSKSDAKKYRTREEEAYWREVKDPIAKAKVDFVKAGVFTEDEAEAIRQSAFNEVEAAVEFANAGETVGLDQLYTNVLAD